ncbi:MAG: nucleotide exchange factor GrpE [Betaproteobacteria bacterium RIFCSPLOWO2_12_FULL_63_13]|nr:MAG: nucleotide exchange factor GrpE [Betaproteobacteria bacterium RIFCSPLOWO2_12_FULL_63_13]
MREELQPEPESPQDAASEQSAESTESAPDTETLLRQAELKAQESHDAWLRAKAEADNVRKRAQVDIANAHKYATEGFASDLLPVKDSLEAALAAENATLDALKSGVELTLKQLSAVFDKANLKEVNPEGEKFDPHRHQAISMLPSDKEPNTVINVLQKGYLLHDRVIRPALVTVAQNKDA